MNNRTYRYFKEEPLYPFGHGLSYTSFVYNNLKIKQTKSNEVLVSVAIKNSGNTDGDDVAQLYLDNKKPRFKAANVALKGFERIHLKVGESKRIVFKLHERELSELDESGKSFLIKQPIEFSVGGIQPTESAILAGRIIQKTYQLVVK